MQRLRGIDSMFVSLESPTNLFHVGAVAVLDPSTAPPGSPPPDEALRAVLASRLDRLPSLRRRLVPVPGGLQHPRWVDAVPDLDFHVRRRAVPRPGGEQELAAYTADVLSHPLDRARPLWQLDVVEGLQDGMVAVVAKVHHSVGDATAGSIVTRVLLDWAPVAPPAAGEAPAAGAERAPDPLVLLGEALLETARLAVPVARLAVRTAGALMAGIPSRLVPRPAVPGGQRTPRTSLGGRVSPDRVAAVARVDRAEVERVRQLAGVGTGDVVLALTASALRAHLGERGDLPDEALVAFVPAAPAMGDDEGGGTRARSARMPGMLVPLATTVADPAVRLVAVAEAARRAREHRGALPTTLLDDLAELTVPAVLQPAARMARVVGLPVRRPPFNVVVASLPGPRVPVYCAGSEVVAYHPFGPVVDGAGLNVTAVSYRDQVGFGLLGCRQAIPDIGALAERIPEALRQLTKALTGGGRRRWSPERRSGTGGQRAGGGRAPGRSAADPSEVAAPGR